MEVISLTLLHGFVSLVCSILVLSSTERVLSGVLPLSWWSVYFPLESLHLVQGWGILLVLFDLLLAVV